MPLTDVILLATCAFVVQVEWRWRSAYTLKMAKLDSAISHFDAATEQVKAIGSDLGAALEKLEARA